ncbi:tyrosine-protein phosphatase [Leucobacter chromiiresistens]|uniref:Tyrosine phosphatase family protein n=2 Tax=Leucobacter chromiiresistens TaxID=1079994 RepID=A0A1H0Z872_9MICO|nr:tyrosine-protein phosphatase [Leucobacter chromiiresistens]SDQ23667.1 Tyrosine phosphatase family protein [Leucobacter chromiiresistens]
MHVITLEGSYNARGIGSGRRPWLVRSAGLDALTAGGERTLRDVGVDLVIDLREGAEHAGRSHAIPVRSVPLYGETPPASGSLETVYAGLVRERGARLAAAVIAIAEHPGTAVVHCTAGKDRTGLVVAIARLAAGDARADVVADYAASGAAVRPARQAIAAAQLSGLGLTAEARAASERLHLDSPAEALEAALDIVDELGGVAHYLRTHGAGDAHLAALAALAERAGGRTAVIAEPVA